MAEPIALTSIFPYAWALVKKFHVGDEQDASFYSGLLISAFSLAEAAMGMYWGGLSDRIGRKPVLILGCMGTMLSMVAVGFASNIWIALAGRAFGGFLNGNIGVIQTMVGELVTKPEHEREFRPCKSDSCFLCWMSITNHVCSSCIFRHAFRLECRHHYWAMHRRYLC